LMPSFEDNFFTLRHEICSQETRDSTLPYDENPESLSHLGLNWYPVVTDGQAVAPQWPCCLAHPVRAVVRKNKLWWAVRMCLFQSP